MRILVQLPNPSYLRMYGSTVRLLGERGHSVLLSYDKPDKLRSAADVSAEQTPGVELVSTMPWTEGPWKPLARHVRLGADYVRYLHPDFANAPYLRRRMDKFLPHRLERLKDVDGLSARRTRMALRCLLAVERAIPPDPAVMDHLRRLGPDCVLVSPFIARGESGVRQTETVKASRAMDIPVAVGISSWDHLTSKGILRLEPDVVLLWNDAQAQEAVRLHGLERERVVVTGAQLFDQWFARRPQLSREAFAEAVGLDPQRPFVVYVGSSRNIAEPEAEHAFIRRWIAGLRAHPSPVLNELGVLVRPHPGNLSVLAGADLSDLGNAVVAPRSRPKIPMDEGDEALYHHSLAFGEAVVGINTSAMIEAAAVGRSVFTIQAPDFAGTQDGTLHFRHLVQEGRRCVRAASGLDEHFGQLAAALDDPGPVREEVARFVGFFVRPHGLDRPATPIVADALERLSRSPSRSWATSWRQTAVRPALHLLDRRLAAIA